MFCPRCGSTQDEQFKFCKACGANMFAVRQVVDTRETDEKFDWSNTWVAEMFRSAGENKRLKLESERRAGITPEIKRVTEIKAGVITSSVGVGLAIFLFVFMQGIILGGNLSQIAIEILSRLWIVGVIPLFVGLALIINGVIVSKRLVELSKQPDELMPGDPTEEHALPSADTNEFAASRFSVTEGTTKHLQGHNQKR